MLLNYSKELGAITRAIFLAFVAFAFLLVAMPAGAELGGDVSTIQADQEHMKGTRRVFTTTAYSVHEMQAATGTTVREFVSHAGTVFGVAWQGPSTPDLRQLLGRYFDQYAQAIQNKRSGRAPLSIHDGILVVEAGGHMRSFSGRAYVPAMVPQGVAPETIK